MSKDESKDKDLKLDSEFIEVEDKDGNRRKILKRLISEFNENNMSYHWVEVRDCDKRVILVKRRKDIVFDRRH